MKNLDIRRCAPIFAATVIIMAGCSGVQTQSALPLAAQGDAVHHGSRAGRPRAWMSPRLKTTDLLYVSDDRGDVDVFAYPDGKREGILTNFGGPSGLCSDKKGDVFITDTANQDIIEYAHGGAQPIANLMEYGVYPYGCSVDPTTGNLAVTNFESNPIGPGSVAIWAGARGGSRTFTAPNFNVYLFCGYDNGGNLYIDGLNSGTMQSLFAVLPKGGASFTDVGLNHNIGYPGGVQWDGKDVAVEDVASDTVYRVKVSGSSGTVVGSSHLNVRSHLVVQFWIAGRTLIVPYGLLNRRVKKVGFWPYPAGGSPTKTIAVSNATEFVGVTVSLAR
jgi:hypothetical protein